MPYEYENTSSYDLSSTGTILELGASELVEVGYQFDASSAVDIDIEIETNKTGPFVVDSFSGVDRIDDVRSMPEATLVRMKNTSTANDTAEAAMGGAG